MNGPHDLGGRDGFGPLPLEPDEPLFHAPWEARALAVTLASGALGHWTLDESRHARETTPPAIYYGTDYYTIWITALEKLLDRHGEVTAHERATATALHPGRATARRLTAANVPAALARGAPVDRPATSPARFAPGDAVRTRNHQPHGHTRLPAYARDKPGRIEALRGVHVYPDTHAHPRDGGGEAPCWLYTVSFKATDLFGAGADPTLTVSIDAWEPYLDAV